MPSTIRTSLVAHVYLCTCCVCNVNAEPVSPDLAYTVMHMPKRLCRLQTAEVAGKESSIEVALDKMAAEWATAEISVLEYRDTGTFIIKIDEAVLQQLDDHIGGLVPAMSHT